MFYQNHTPQPPRPKRPFLNPAKFSLNPFPYGKLAGLISGFILTLSPMGMLAGFLFGTLVDRMAKWQTLKLRTSNTATQTFSLAAIALFAQVAKADGKVTRAEVKAFRDFAAAPKKQSELIGEIFNQARQSQTMLEEAVEAVHQNKNIPLQNLTRLIDGLCTLAQLDGGPSQAQKRLITATAERWGIDITPFANSYGWPEFQQKRQHHTHSTGSTGQSGGSSHSSYQRSKLHNDALDGQDPYEVLGVNLADDLQTIKKAYKKLVIKSHPDRLKAQGKSEAQIKQAEEQLMVLNAAFDQIEKEKS